MNMYIHINPCPSMLIKALFLKARSWKQSKCSFNSVWINKLVSPYNGILLSNRRIWTTFYRQHGWISKHYAKWKKSDKKKLKIPIHIELFHFMCYFGKGKTIWTEIRSLVPEVNDGWGINYKGLWENFLAFMYLDCGAGYTTVFVKSLWIILYI